MPDKYRHTGWKKFYLIFGMYDESFSINCSADIPKGDGQGPVHVFRESPESALPGGSAARRHLPT